MTTKFFFAFFIANDGGNEESFSKFDDAFDKKDPDNNAAIVKKNFEEQLGRLKKFGHYYDQSRNRIVFFGVADSTGIVNVVDGQASLSGQSQGGEANKNTGAGKFVNDISLSLDEKFEFSNDRCTWIVVPLDELASGYGTLFVEGMAGESGGG